MNFKEKGIIIQAETLGELEALSSLLTDNNIDINCTVDMNIPTIQLNGDILNIELPILAMETDFHHEVSLNDHSLIMALDDQSVNYEYTVNTEDSGDALKIINSTNDIVISISLEGETPGDEITFSDFTGWVAPQDLGFDGTINLDSDSEINEALLGNGLLEILIQNNVNQTYLGAPTAVITIPELRTPEGIAYEVILDHFYGDQNETINLSEFSLFPNPDQQLSYNADVTTQYEETGSYSLINSIIVEIHVKNLSFDEVTGKFDQDAMVDSNSISIDDSTKIASAEIKSGELLLDIENNIGVVADINFQILEFSMDESNLDTTISLTPSGGTYTIDLSDYQLNLDMSEDPQTVNYISTISLPDSIEMTLSLNESIAVSVNLSNLTFESVTGDIKQMTVEIDTVIQKIDGLPEEIEDFAFTAVNMFIEFDTDIGAPENSIDVILDLEITALSSTDSITSEITGWNIIDSSRVIIPDAEALINIFPDTIRASGSATVSGSGRVTNTQFVSGIMTVEAPLKFDVPDSTEIDMDIEELYKRYVVKNQLNTFRQRHGYKEGSYIKLWNTVEDNVVAFNIMDENPSISPSGLYQKLELKYSQIG